MTVSTLDASDVVACGELCIFGCLGSIVHGSVGFVSLLYFFTRASNDLVDVRVLFKLPNGLVCIIDWPHARSGYL